MDGGLLTTIDILHSTSAHYSKNRHPMLFYRDSGIEFLSDTCVIDDLGRSNSLEL